MNRKLLVILSALLLLAMPQVLAQQDDGYNEFGDEPQTRAIPAGTVVEPGSQLLFLLDTGIDANVWDIDEDPDTEGKQNNFASYSVSELSGGTVTAPITPEFIAITNTNPTDAVTVHFRYFNSDCEDILDFLVILTCNDTFMVDPFNFNIPGADKSTGQRFFGASLSNPMGMPACDGTTAPCWDPTLPGISGAVFDDGRFLLHVTASGDPYDTDEIADWLFPKELASDMGDCDAVVPSSVGAEAGLNDDNLHILYASAISFNYLNGFLASAIPTPTGNASYGTGAFVRPAVDLGADGNTGISGGPDGDGIQAGKRYILSGSENIQVNRFPDDTALNVNNLYYLRNETHGGDVKLSVNNDGAGFSDETVISQGGALDWTLWAREATGGVPDENQRVMPASLLDDYNGSNNDVALFKDASYRIDPVITFYALQIFNNDEEPLSITIQPPTISPPICPDPTLDPTSCSIALAVAVRCLNAWNVGPATNQVTTEIGALTLADVVALRPAQINAHLTPKAEGELGPGWIRIKRIVTRLDFQLLDGTEVELIYDGSRASIATFMLNTIRYNDFGVAWYLPAAASVTPVPAG